MQHSPIWGGMRLETPGAAASEADIVLPDTDNLNDKPVLKLIHGAALKLRQEVNCEGA